jgi:hypothetical protein
MIHSIDNATTGAENMETFNEGQRVSHQHSSACVPTFGTIKEIRISEYKKGCIWLANSYYVIHSDDGETYITDFVDAHKTFGGMTKAI